MPQGLPGFKEPPDGYVYGKIGELHRTASPAGGTLWLKMSDETLNIGWTKVSGAYVYPTPTPTPSPTHTVTPTTTPVSTVTPTATPTYTPTPTPTPTVTPSIGISPTPTPTVTPTVTPSSTPVFTGIYRTWYTNLDYAGSIFFTEPAATDCQFYFSGGGPTAMSPNVPGYPSNPPPNDPIFSCRMSASLWVPATDTYYISAESDDSLDLYIAGVQRIYTTGGSSSATASLTAGWNTFEVRYNNYACCTAMVSLSWKRASVGGYTVLSGFANGHGPIPALPLPSATPAATPTSTPATTPTPTATPPAANCYHLYIISSTGGSVTYSYYDCGGGSTNGATTGPAGVLTDTGNCGDSNHPIISVTGGSAFFTDPC